MTTENAILMQQARESLDGKWGLAVGTSLVFFLINLFLQFIPIINIFLTPPFIVGTCIFYLSISRNQDAKMEQVFQGFNNYGTALGAFLLTSLFTFLWTLLLIIPGIIASLSYAMTFCILADDSSIGAMDAINKSKEMMDGHKWKLFCLGLRFSGWSLLCLLTLGIGFLWLGPYMGVSFAKFYDDIKANSLNNTVVSLTSQNSI